MNTKLPTWIAVGGAIIGVAAVASAVWFIFLKPVPQLTTSQNQNGGLSTGANTQTTGVSSNTNAENTNQVSNIGQTASSQKVFKIADGPVSGATFTQTFNPTTTLARYSLQENGHVMDQPIDVPGSLARAVSNTTIPGTASVVWGKGGSVAYMQYQDDAITKTVSLVFPIAATSSRSVSRPVNIQFLPDNVRAVAVSPSGLQVAYLLSTASGSDGYVANTDGSSAKKIFSLGFKELLLSWPSEGRLLLATKSASGVPGMVLSVDAKTGGITPLIYSSGITAMANPTLNYVLYQADTGQSSPSSYARDTKRGADIPLSFNPIPEKCVGSIANTNVVYCAVPPVYFDTTYLDLWHLGAKSLSDIIVSFTLNRQPNTDILATPGSDGGVQSDILEMAVSPDDKYLLFIKKGDRSLWGVRLTQ